MKDALDQLDIDGSGTIEFNEFCEMMANKEASDPEEELRLVMRSFLCEFTLARPVRNFRHSKSSMKIMTVSCRARS